MRLLSAEVFLQTAGSLQYQAWTNGTSLFGDFFALFFITIE